MLEAIIFATWKIENPAKFILSKIQLMHDKPHELVLWIKIAKRKYPYNRGK